MKKSIVQMTPSGVVQSADKICTGDVLRHGGELALTERPPLPVFIAGHHGSTSGKTERKCGLNKVVSFFSGASGAWDSFGKFLYYDTFSDVCCMISRCVYICYGLYEYDAYLALFIYKQFCQTVMEMCVRRRIECIVNWLP
jgi:hypothetical protein